ncbi:MAG: glycosyltransferase family 2 protein [bacterium]
MIIDITKSGYQQGYLPKGGVGVFHAFFPTANCAVRREAIARASGEAGIASAAPSEARARDAAHADRASHAPAFDTHCATGEDIDLSIRVARAGYELWFEPTAKVVHHHRHTMRGLLRQWFAYGLGHAYLYKKHSPRRRFEIFRYDLSPANTSPFGIRRIAALPSPARAMVFVTSFHVMHAAAAAAIVARVANAPAAIVWTLAALTAATAAWYFGIRFEGRQPLRSIAFSAIRYIADASYVIGGLIGGIREGMIYVEATRTRRRPRAAG